MAAGLLAGACIASLWGCAGAPELGRPLPVDRLSQLQPGVSSADEVVRVLGEPQGRGAGRLPGVPLHDLLLYESDLMDGGRIRMRMLIVFLDRTTGAYEGYMWFRSGMTVDRSNRDGSPAGGESH